PDLARPPGDPPVGGARGGFPGAVGPGGALSLTPFPGGHGSGGGNGRMSRADRHKLHFGPYRPPPLRRGDRAFCHFRDCQVLITGWSDARIPWPRCRAIGIRGGSGLLVDDELARALRNQSAAAGPDWWGAPVTALHPLPPAPRAA